MGIIWYIDIYDIDNSVHIIVPWTHSLMLSLKIIDKICNAHHDQREGNCLFSPP